MRGSANPVACVRGAIADFRQCRARDVSEIDPSVQPLKKVYAEVILQRMDLMTDSSGRYMQLGRGFLNEWMDDSIALCDAALRETLLRLAAVAPVTQGKGGTAKDQATA